MNKEIRDKWVARLRDPESRQARNALEDPATGGMCCLGHLCHVLGVPKARGKGDGDVEVVLFDDDTWTSLPLGVRAEARLSAAGFFKYPVCYKGRKYDDLSQLNDSGLASLAEIADIIEREDDAGNLLEENTA